MDILCQLSRRNATKSITGYISISKDLCPGQKLAKIFLNNLKN